MVVKEEGDEEQDVDDDDNNKDDDDDGDVGDVSQLLRERYTALGDMTRHEYSVLGLFVLLVLLWLLRCKLQIETLMVCMSYAWGPGGLDGEKNVYMH